MKQNFLYFCLLAFWTSCKVCAASSFVVESPVGKIQGMEMTATNGEKYVGFRGIPYAKPPVGELRFAKPQPHPAFKETFDATQPIALCPQAEGMYDLDEFGHGVEDCLVLNIFTKELDQGQQKKVLVFIHGGGFIIGSSMSYDAGSFVTGQDVIMVTINYRLGILGFLSTENEASLGNYGMWDQALALKWVKKNIASFGGDPDDITIYGESAGGASVAILSISPYTKGLFSKVYPMSGTATAKFANTNDAQLSALQVAKFVDCWDGETDKKIGLAQSQAIIACLRERPLANITKFPVMNTELTNFVPCVDGEFILDVPAKLLQDDQYLESVGFFGRSYLFGINNNERSMMDMVIEAGKVAVMSIPDKTDEEKLAIISDYHGKSWKNFVSSRLGFSDLSEELINKIRDWYDRRNVNTSISDMITDLSFLIPTFDFVDALARKKFTNVYLLYFNHFPTFMKGNYKGMPHGGDLLYVFDMEPSLLEIILRAGLQGNMTKDELELKALFSSVIATFVKTGNPGSALTEKLPSGWPIYDLETCQYLDFNPDPLVMGHLERDKRKFWAETVPGWASNVEYHTVHTEL